MRQRLSAVFKSAVFGLRFFRFLLNFAFGKNLRRGLLRLPKRARAVCFEKIKKT